MPTPLNGVKVLELTRVLSGPFCTGLSGDMAAVVSNVAAPEGDSVRGQGAIKDGLSWYIAPFNRNERSRRLDMRKAAAKAIPAGRMMYFLRYKNVLLGAIVG